MSKKTTTDKTTEIWTLGATIRSILDLHDITQMQAAEQCGMDPKSFNDIVNGRRVPNDRTVKKIARGLNTDPDMLFLSVGRIPPGIVMNGKNMDRLIHCIKWCRHEYVNE